MNPLGKREIERRGGKKDCEINGSGYCNGRNHPHEILKMEKHSFSELFDGISDDDFTPCSSLIFPSDQTLYVRVERKRPDDHPFYGRGSPMGYAVSRRLDGDYVQGATIRLPYSKQTSLVIHESEGHPLYLTRDPIGGTQKLEGKLMRPTSPPDNPMSHYIQVFGPISTEEGTMRFVPRKHLILTKQERVTLKEGSDTVKLYYQCDNHPMMGGIIEIVPSTEVIMPLMYFAVARLRNQTKKGLRLKAWKQMGGLNQPTFGVHSRDPEGRFFYVGEQGGKIWEIDTFTMVRSSVLRVGPFEGEDPMEHAGMWAERSLFMDVSIHMEGVYSRKSPFAGVNVDERGLLGMAFHPQYHDFRLPNANVFFLYMSQPPADPFVDHDGCLWRYRAIRTPPEMSASGLPSTGAMILCVSEPFSNHNGGTIGFSPRDGMLYVGLGDGGSQNDPLHRAPDLDDFHGKILRLDVDAYDRNMHYRVPSDNPFVDVQGARPEIYAYGFRNPWGFDFYSSMLIVSDTGHKLVEEVNEVKKGGFYGWSFREGTKRVRKTVTKEDRAKVRKAISPVFSYAHGSRPDEQIGKLPERMAIVGAKVYTGTKHKRIRGAVIIADMSGWLGLLVKRRKSKKYFLAGQGHLPSGETIRALCKTLDGTVYALTHDESGGEEGGAIWEISL